MSKRLMLYILPMIAVLFSCILALPGQDTGPVASEDEPTPIPLGQATTTIVSDLPDTPTSIPAETPIPSPTPTPAVVGPIAEGEKMALLCAFVL